PGVTCYAGAQTLERFLGRCDILVCLLPLTAATHRILDRRLFSALPRGASLINVGRGGHLDQRALLEALDSGHLCAAILDVCEPEPLPQSHPFWSHPRDRKSTRLNSSHVATSYAASCLNRPSHSLPAV